MNLICIWYVMESCQGEEARESRIYKVHIASRILSGMEKDTPLREETSANFGLRKWWRVKDCKLWNIVNIIERIERQLRAMAEQEEKRKTERVNESAEWTVIKQLFNKNLEQLQVPVQYIGRAAGTKL